MPNNLIRSGSVTVYPAIPGVPFRPAYTVTERVRVQDLVYNSDVTWVRAFVPGDANGTSGYAGAPMDVWFPVPNNGDSLFGVVEQFVTITRVIPAQPAIPAVPERRVSVPPEGWTSYARSVAPLYEGTARFNVRPTVKGGVIGLAQLAVPTVGYNHIPQGLLFTGGQVRNVRTNVSYGTYGTTDLFRIRREGNTVTFLKNLTVLDTEVAAYGPDQPLFLSATLYAVQDSILNPALTPSERTGSSEGIFPSLAALSADGEYAESRAEFPTIVSESGVVSESRAIFESLAAFSADRAMGQSINLLPGLTAFGYADAWDVEPQNDSFALFANPVAASIMLNGELGESAGTFGEFEGFSADRSMGQGRAVFSGLTARSWTSPADRGDIPFVVGVRVAMTPRTLINERIDFGFGLDVQIGEDLTAQERVDFKIGLDIPMTFSTVDVVSIEPVFWFSVPIDVPGAFTDTWVMNLRTGASSRYESYPFESTANIGGRYFAAGAEGLYELGGDDDDGAPIEAVIDFGLKSFGSNQLKRLEQIYLTVASDGPMFVRVTAEGASYTYTMRDFNEAMQTQRVTPGKGMRANYFGFEVGNIDGADFELSAVEVLVAESARRI